MAIWLIVYENGTARLTESSHNPVVLATVDVEIETCVPFHNWEDAQTAMEVIRAYQTEAKPSMSRKYAVDGHMLDEKTKECENLAEMLKKAQESAKQFYDWYREQLSKNNAIMGILRRVMRDLALQTVLQNTHRERNEENRLTVRYIKDALDGLIYSHDINDDIPF